MLIAKEDDLTLYEDDTVAVELGNGEEGATIYVFDKRGDGVVFTLHRLEDLLDQR